MDVDTGRSGNGGKARKSGLDLTRRIETEPLSDSLERSPPDARASVDESVLDLREGAGSGGRTGTGTSVERARLRWMRGLAVLLLPSATELPFDLSADEPVVEGEDELKGEGGDFGTRSDTDPCDPTEPCRPCDALAGRPRFM
ncbi:MAG: hypothetical protein EOO22_08195 [Comamonadaceae bacterium]|nr:MAG: hypothetical protein EOO22_08195 [Comamonadaceae bacterium]